MTQATNHPAVTAGPPWTIVEDVLLWRAPGAGRTYIPVFLAHGYSRDIHWQSICNKI